MEEVYIADKTFTKADIKEQQLPKGEYEHCSFEHADLAGADLSGIHFINCRFTGCNLGLVKLSGTALNDVQFKGCKMIGVQFDQCSPFGFTVRYEDCMLDDASFYKLKMKKTVFKNSQLRRVDFTETDLSAASFALCDLALAKFDHTILEGADFREAYHYSIDPSINKMKKAKFSQSGLEGLLEKYELVIER
jgi:fluoroquinolone resistance protein